MSERPDRGKLRDKIQFIRSEVRLLQEIAEDGEASFLDDLTAQHAATRCIQIAVEAMLDAANHIIAREGLGTPKTYREAMQLLVKHDILPRDGADTFSDMVGFRNRAVHLYDEIEPGEIWKIMTSHLEDFEVFIGALVRRYFEGQAEC